MLRAYTEQHGFNHGFFALSPPEVTREIGNKYGQSYINPPNVPMLLIRPDNSILITPFGIKPETDLEALIETNRLP